MRVRIFTEPQRGATYLDQLRLAQHAETCGFDGYFRADHYLSPSGTTAPPGPTDAWLTLAALGRETRRIRLGTLVTAATFRPPAALAIIVAQADQMSGGRVELGLGAGWYEREHLVYGIPFPPPAERFERLTEQLAIVSGMWATPAGEVFNHRGKHYDLVDAPALPRPAQVPGPPIIVGGRGAKRTPALAARYATEYNAPFTSVAVTARQFDLVREASEQVGRDTPPVLSVSVAAFCGRTESQARARMTPFQERGALPPEDAVVGPPQALLDRLGALAEIGATRVYLRMDIADLAHLDLIAAEVLPHLC